MNAVYCSVRGTRHVLVKFRSSLDVQQHRALSVSRTAAQKVPSTMSAWQLNSYGTPDQLTLSTKVPVPKLRRGDVLVQVHAASVNPIDVLIVSGYGSKILNAVRGKQGYLCNGSEFPLTPGRDFSGRIVEIGSGVDGGKFRVGDEVYGAVDLPLSGTHAQFIAVATNGIGHKPASLSHIEAASLAYVASTSWAAVCTWSGYTQKSLANKRVLIVGGSGGVGTFAIQWLKAWGAHVTTTCSTGCIDAVRRLGADVAVDYTKSDVRQQLLRLPRFDLIYDLVGGQTTEYAPKLLAPYTGATYVRIVMPLMRNVDELGVARGLARCARQFGAEQFQALLRGTNIRWGLFRPSSVAMETIAKLVDEKKIVPQVERVYSFADLRAAYAKVAPKHNRGKTVIDVIGSSS